ncbi:MAG TPA: zinc ribbon domain-containing protein [Polyangiaceae bacterium]
MSEAEVQRCPVCGAPVARGARRCDYCSSDLATVRCAGCFTMNPADSLRCSGCGRELGLEPIATGKSALECPECRSRFAAYGGHGGVLGECETCGGQFVEHSLLEELLERREVHRPVSRTAPPPENPLKKPVRYLKCPSCQAMMNRNNFGGTSGIVVDVCALHGVWFEAGELPRVLAFVQAGGLERARAHKQAERVRRERDRRIDAASSRLPAVTPGNDKFEWATSFADGMLEFVALVAEAVAKKH